MLRYERTRVQHGSVHESMHGSESSMEVSLERKQVQHGSRFSMEACMEAGPAWKHAKQAGEEATRQAAAGFDGARRGAQVACVGWWLDV
eukprot:364487-Chlamydomonas_euryale.AAC.26